MKKLFFLQVLSAFLSFNSFSPASQDLILSLGETKSLSIKGQPPVWVQDREILKVEDRGSKILLRAGREGRTLLKIGEITYNIQIIHPLKTNALQEFTTFLKSFVGLKTEIRDGDLLVTGNIYRLKDWLKISEFAQSKYLNYQMRAQIPSELKKEIQNYFSKIYSQEKIAPQTLIFEKSPTVRVNATGEVFEKYSQLFKPFGVRVEKDLTSLEIAPNIKVEITVVEMKKNFKTIYGFKWPSTYAANVIDNALEGFSSGDPLQLHLLEERGHGKILASPNIICRSGNEAEFLAGGEIPIKILHFKSQEVLWKRYGILLKVKPRADSSGRISLNLETEITTIDTANSVDNIPAMLTNRISSHFDLTQSQTIALSGLIKNESGENSAGLPLASRIPILGSLFSSKEFRDNRSELIIFVRPTIVKEDTSETLEHLNTGKESDDVAPRSL